MDSAHDRLFPPRRSLWSRLRLPFRRRPRTRTIPDAMIPSVWAADLLKNLADRQAFTEALRQEHPLTGSLKINSLGSVSAEDYRHAH